MTNTGNIEVVDVTEHEDGGATYTFDLDEDTAKVAQELGLKLILYCGFSGVSVEDAFKSILDRADYLNQEPDLLNSFDEYGHYGAGAAEQALGENNPPVGERKETQ